MKQSKSQTTNASPDGCTIVAGIVSAVFLLLILACIISFVIPTNPITLASSMAQVDIPTGVTVRTNDDTGPGLPIPGGASDGYTFLVIQIPPAKISEFSQTLTNSNIWKPLPLPQEFIDNEWLLQPDNGTIPLDTLKGSYLFVDRQDSYNKNHKERRYDTSQPFYERYSFNFTFGLFDDKTGLLYLWRLDT
ncbi:MAG: hypothetical protein ACOYZ6_06055 [Chloroflexota bacterium]